MDFRGSRELSRRSANQSGGEPARALEIGPGSIANGADIAASPNHTCFCPDLNCLLLRTPGYGLSGVTLGDALSSVTTRWPSRRFGTKVFRTSGCSSHRIRSCLAEAESDRVVQSGRAAVQSRSRAVLQLSGFDPGPASKPDPAQSTGGWSRQAVRVNPGDCLLPPGGSKTVSCLPSASPESSLARLIRLSFRPRKFGLNDCAPLTASAVRQAFSEESTRRVFRYCCGHRCRSDPFPLSVLFLSVTSSR